MCDTIGKISSPTYAIFGKNSDRAVNEPQLVEFYPAKDYPEGSTVKCTYISVPQAAHTNAIVLSRPSWIWGGEIGVNEHGVCIGNEAVFTKGKYGPDSLIGMDLLRLALERGNTAWDAMHVIIQLLEEYGQGGNCGYDTDFRYDNSFLIMDRTCIYVLETCGKDYVYKKYTRASISNRLSIGKNGDYYKNRKIDFKKAHSDFIKTTGAKGATRRGYTGCATLTRLEDMMLLLRTHADDNVFCKGSVGSVCMHASNPLTADQTTMSMIVELKEDDIVIWITGCSLPCVSLFKPHKFGVNGLISDGVGTPDYWYKREQFTRQFLNHEIPEKYFLDLLSTQRAMFDVSDVDEALQLEEAFYKRNQNIYCKKKMVSPIYKAFWNKKNKVFKEEMK